MTATPGVNAVQIELWNLVVPLAEVLEASAGPRKRTAHVLIVFMHGANQRGIGYSIFRERGPLVLATRAAQKLAGAVRPELPALLDIERFEVRNPAGDATASRSAANALSLAAWDLAARQRGCAAADLWGRPAGRTELECYASALWQEQSVDELIVEAKRYRDLNFRYVKMRVVHDLADNLERIAAVRSVYTGPATIAIEAAGAQWNINDANEFMEAAAGKYLWTEDPVKYDAIGQVRETANSRIVAGETCATTAELIKLFDEGNVRSIVIDVQCIGGPVRFMEAARLLQALGATIGGHRFPYYSSHLLAALPKSLPLETIDWANPSLEPYHAPDKNGRVPVEGPGFAIRMNQAVFERYARRVV
jgi:L-alanine-DL-glutamate epimerase-like enolase superfamily enzyme